MTKWKRRIGGGLAVIILIMAVVYLWSNLPITTNENKADPAVTLANEIGKQGGAYREGFVGERGSRIHYVSAGQGETIVFLHGFPSYWFTMFGLMEEFKQDYNVIAVDGLGTGKSDAPNSVKAYELRNMVRLLDGVISETAGEQIHLVGHDWGAAMAAAYAQAYPEKVKTITMMSALPHNILLPRLETDKDHQELFSYTSKFSRANPALIKLLGIQDSIWTDIYQPFLEQGLISKAQGERFRQDIGQPRRLNRFINWYRANIPNYEEIDDRHYWPKRNARLTQPALFMYGDTDIVVTDELLQDLKATSDNLKIIEFEDTEHRPHYEEKQAVIANIRSLLASE